MDKFTPLDALDCSCHQVSSCAVNAKISEGLVNKLPYDCFRFWPFVLWPLPEDFEKVAFAEEYLS